MADVETTLNTHLARLLNDMRYNWTAKAEQGHMMKKRAQIDVLIEEPGWKRVIVECKIGMKPDDIRKRFENRFRDDNTVPAVIFEVKYDESLQSWSDLETTEKLHYSLHYDANTRYPNNGFLTGTVRDLAVSIQYGRVIPGDHEAAIMHDAVSGAGVIIGRTSARSKISQILSQEVSIQTDVMAALTLAGALSFHDTAAVPEGITTLGGIMFSGKADVASLLESWRRILLINYYPIFDPARKILAALPMNEASEIMGMLYNANSRIHAQGESPDLYGMVFQRVINDRKRLAAFYTKPASAALLAAVTIPDQWHDTESVKNIRVADFACGTGALLHAAYKRISANYEAASGLSMRDIHPHMMAHSLIGADVLPISTHLTAAGLTSMYPKRSYSHTKIYQPIQGGRDNRLGSLEWIKNDATIDQSELRLTGSGISGEMDAPPHHSCDCILMNPPYVRSQGPGGNKNKSDTRQMFTAFGATSAEREKMSQRAIQLFKKNRSCSNKQAGLATFFMDLAHKKIKKGGYLGVILPMTAATGVKWEQFRNLISKHYDDVIIISGQFSADTGMKEIIVSGRRTEKPSGRGIFVSLNETPQSTLEGVCTGMAIWEKPILPIDGNRPTGGTSIKVGDDCIGTAIEGTIDGTWSAVGMSNFTLLQIAHHLVNGQLFSPPSFISEPLHIIPLRDIASAGPSHLQIRGTESLHDTTSRMTGYSGPFNLVQWWDGCLYPTLWNNDHSTQHSMMVKPDHSLEPRQGSSDDVIERIWDTRSHVQMNITARTTSQRLMCAYTEQPVVGGSAWPSIILKREWEENIPAQKESVEKGLVVWCNGTLGILMRWYISGHQQSGRSITTRTGVMDLPVPAIPLLKRLGSIYDEFKNLPLDRMMNLWKDENRIRMDDAILERLGLDINLDYIRKHLCAEPTMNGS